MTRIHRCGRAFGPMVVLVSVLPWMLGQGCPPTQGTGDGLSVSAGEDAATTVGTPVTLQGSATGGSGVYEFSWTPTANLDDATSSTPIFTPTAAGTTTFLLTVTDSLGTQASDAVIVEVTGTDDDNDAGAGAPLVADAGPSLAVVVNSPVVLQGAASGGQSPYTYSWSPTDGLSDPTLPQPSFTPTAAGETTFTLTVTDDDGNTATDTATITASTETTLDSLTWSANFDEGGYEMVAVFSQELDRVSAQNENNYRVSGTELEPESAVLASDDRTLTLNFLAPLSTSSAIDFSMSNGLLDAIGNPLPAFSAVPQVNTGDTASTAPEIAAAGVKWGIDYAGSYQLLVNFTEAMDRASAETLSAYRINGTSLTASEATLDEDGQMVSVIFDNVALSTDAKIDISVGNIIKDINGNAAAQRLGVTIAVNSADTTSPNVVEVLSLGEGNNGFEVSIEFSEAMSREDVEKTQAYQGTGSLLQTPTDASLSNDGRTVILVFDDALAPTDRVRIGLGNLVKDINSRIFSQINAEIGVETGDVTDPNGPALKWVIGGEADGYQLLAVFPEAMLKSTVEDENNWRLAGTTVKPSEVTLANDVKTATISFDIPVRRDARITVSVNDRIRDASGNAMLEADLPVSSNPADTVSPKVVIDPTWVADYGTVDGQVGYRLTLSFSETMDLKSVSNLANYTMVRVDTSVTPHKPLGSLGGPSQITVDPMGRKLTMTFASTSGGFRGVTSSLIRDRLLISSQVRDMNGKSTSSVQPQAIAPNAETNGPVIESIAWSTQNNNQPYQVVVRFNEALDAASAADAANYRVNLDGAGVTEVAADANDLPTAPTLNADGRSVTLSFSEDANAFFSSLADTLIVDAGQVLDINGNPSAGTAAAGESIAQDPVTDTVAPRLLSTRWVGDPSLQQYRLIAEFSEPLDENTLGIVQIVKEVLCAICILGEEGDLTLLPGGNRLEVLFDDEPLPTDAMVAFGEMSDMNGNLAEPISILPEEIIFVDTLPNPLDSTAPSPIPVEIVSPPDPFENRFARYDVDFPGPGYQVLLPFDEVLDITSATTRTHYRVGVDGTLFYPNLELPPALSVDGFTVSLNFLTPLSVSAGTDYFDFSVAASVKDLNGNAVPQYVNDPLGPPFVSIIAPNPDDTNPPTIMDVNYQDALNPQTFTITFSEVMDRDAAEDPANYTWEPLDIVTTTGLKLENDGTTLQLQIGLGEDAAGATLNINVTDINGNANEPCTDCGPF